MDVINAETARGAAIAGTAYLDLLLRAALELFMRDDATLSDTLFENRGALQDFATRIKIAYAFNIIGHAAYDDMNILKDIRNAFAHSVEKLDFDTPEIAGLCKRLWYPAKIGRGGRPIPTDPRGLFLGAVEHLTIGLYYLRRELERPGTPFVQIGPPRQANAPTSPKKLKLRVSRGRPQSPTAPK